MKRIAIIPARSGSKGLKDKNIKELAGKPLMAYSIESAIRSGCFDKIFVSTDSQHYADIAEKYGADASFLRSIENSSDMADSWSVVREVIARFQQNGEEYDEIMLLQPTSPLREADDIKNAVELLYDRCGNAVISVTECDHSPLWCNTLPSDGCMDQFIRREVKGVPRQELPKYYRYNGAIYLLTMSELENRSHMFEKECYAYIMDQKRSIDIDSELDFLIAEMIMKNQSDFQ